MDRPVATCRKCNTTCEFRKFLTFCHWWCPKCKDEPDAVELATTGCPRAEKYGYRQEDGDYLLNEPGIWKLVYTDGSYEFYERRPGASKTILDGARLRSATRLTDGDLPGRKPVQSLSEAGAGGKTEGQGVRPVSAPVDSSAGHLPFYKWSEAWPSTNDREFVGEGVLQADGSKNYVYGKGPHSKIISEAEAKNLCGPNFRAQAYGIAEGSIRRWKSDYFQPQEIPRIRGRDGGILPSDFVDTLRFLGSSNKCVQHGQVPPDDEL